MTNSGGLPEELYRAPKARPRHWRRARHRWDIKVDGTQSLPSKAMERFGLKNFTHSNFAFLQGSQLTKLTGPERRGRRVKSDWPPGAAM